MSSIDHALTNVKSPVCSISFLTLRISDHFPLILALSSNSKKKTYTQKTLTKRIFPSSNNEKFKNLLNVINWGGVVWDAENVQDSYIFNDFYSLHYPVKNVQIQQKHLEKI